MRDDARGRHAVLVLGLVAVAFAGQGVRGLWDPDEGRYAQVALEMVRSGDWMTPHLNAETPHFTKPPLTYWAIAASVAAFGDNEAAVRFPNALAFLVSTLLVASMGRRLLPSNPTLPAAVYATSLLPFAGASYVTTDTLLSLWTTLALWGFVALWKDGRTLAAVWMWVGFGLAFLTKGPPALLLLPPIVLFAAYRRPFPLRRLFPPAGILAFLVLGFGWFAIEGASQPDLLGYFLRREVVERVGTSVHHRNPGLWGWWIYVPTIVVGGLPWWPALLVRREREPSDSRPFLILATTLPLVILCAADSRLPLYLLPLAAPGALAIALRLPTDALRRPAFRIALGAWVVALIGVRVAAGFVPNHRDPRPMARWIRSTLGEPPAEVVFVGSPSRHGVAFYLDCEVEDATLPGEGTDPRWYRPVSEPLPHEIAEEEPGRTVFVVARTASAAFETVARSQGRECRRWSSWREFELYELTSGSAPPR